MFQSLLSQTTHRWAAVTQGFDDSIKDSIKKASQKLQLTPFSHRSVLSILIRNSISSISNDSLMIFHKSAIYKKIGGLSHVSYPMS